MPSRWGGNMKYKIGKKEFDTSRNQQAARFVELQDYFFRTQHDLEEATKPGRGDLVRERNQLAAELEVPWYKLPRLVREYIPQSNFNEM